MVNFESADRQAIGSFFEARGDDEEVATALLNGELTMRPHGLWSLPRNPTWKENPFSDNNWQFQYHMLRWLDPLRRTAQEGNAQAAEAWERYVFSWIKAHPPGKSKSRWAWADMADGIRARELCYGLMVVGEQDWLIRSLEQHRDWLMNPKHIKNGNHGLHQTVGLFVVAAVLEDAGSMNLAAKWLGERLRKAWDKQGVNEEGSIAYHRVNYTWWQEAMTRLDLEGVARPVGADRLELVPEELTHATTPLGLLARIGDTNTSKLRGINHPYVDYVVSAGQQGQAPPSTTAIYDRGYAYIRSGWGHERPFNQETHVAATFGQQKKIHGHNDGGSVTLCSNGVQWLGDGGLFYYGDDPMQTYMKSRKSHNMIVLAGRDADRDRPVELIHQEDCDTYTDLILFDTGYEGVELTRRIIYLKKWDLTLVLDRVQSEEPVEAEQRWHCGLGIEAKSYSSGFALKYKDKACHVASLFDGQAKDIRHGSDNPLVGWTTTGWRASAPVNVGTVYDEGTDLHFGALLGPWSAPAVQLLRQKMAAVRDVFTDIRQVVPAPLLQEPWPEFGKPARRQHSNSIEANIEWVADHTLRIHAAGPGEHFKFDVYGEPGQLSKGKWSRSREQHLEVPGTAEVRVQVWNRKLPDAPQSVSITVPRPSGDKELGYEESSKNLENLVSDDPGNRTLVLLETMFCDNERDEKVLATYFERFKLSLASLLAQKIPEDAELLVTIYISSDKQEWIRRTRRIVEAASHSPRARYRIHEYDHPTEGYPQRDHIDWKKNPNKQAPYRSDHFVKAHSDVQFQEYGRMLRAAIDDDDVMLSFHIGSMLRMADAAQEEYKNDEIIALGPLRTYIGYVEEAEVHFEDVEMRRSISGNSFLLIKNPSVANLASLSPWSIPEVMDVYQGTLAQSRGIRLSYVRGHCPGLAYMRWGYNLSAHRKDFHVLQKHAEFTLGEVEEIHASAQCEDLHKERFSFGLLSPDLRLTVRRRGDEVAVISNFDKLRLRNAQLCFYLMSGKKRIGVRSYSMDPRARFSDAPPRVQVVGFIRFQGKIIARVASERV